MNIFTHRFLTWLLASCCLAAAAAAIAEEDSILIDANGNYIITYRSDAVAGGIARVVWVPSTKIDPRVQWNIKISESKPEVPAYRYTFKNGKTSQQDIKVGRLVASNVVSGTQATPKDWGGSIVNDSGRSSGFIVGWSYDRTGGLKPGSTQGGFGFESKDLPGVGPIELIGLAPAGQSFPDEGPDEVSPIRDQVVDLTVKKFVPRPAAVPRIPVGNPYDGAAVLDALRAHISKDIIELKLIEPTFASQLDRLLQAAAGAVRLNNPKAAREHLQNVMALLKKDHPDCDKEDDDKDDDDEKDTKGETGSIDRLAARVIAFDIKYVEKRLKGF